MISEDRDIVCPACEATFPAAGLADGQVRPCPNCQYSFPWLIRSSAPTVERRDPWHDLLEGLPIPQVVAEHAASQRWLLRAASPQPAGATTLTAAPPVRRPAIARRMAESQSSETSPIAEPELEPSVASLDPRIGLPTSSTFSPLIVLATVALLVTAALIVLVIQQSLKPTVGAVTPEGDLEAVTPSPSTSLDVGTTEDSVKREPIADVTDELTIPNWPAKAPTTPDELWRRIGGYVVSVEQSSPSGITSTGWLVDTRGWILAPLLNDPVSVRVVRAAPSAEPYGSSDSGPVLASRGRPIAAESLGLMLLQVDPSSLIPLTDPPLIHAAAPSFPTVLIGTSSDERWLKVLTQISDLNTDPTRRDGIAANWEGELQGMWVPQVDAAPRWISAAEIAKWLDQIDPESFSITSPLVPEAPTPLPLPDIPRLPTSAEEALAELPALESLQEELLPLDTDGRLARFEDCLELARRVHGAELQEDDAKAASELQTSLSDSVADLRAPWQRSPWPENSQLASWNLRMSEQIRTGHGFWGYGEVESVPPLSPRVGDKDLIILKLIGTETRIGVPVSLAFDAFAPDSRWMVWGIVSPNTWQDQGKSQALIESRYLLEEPQVLFETP